MLNLTFTFADLHRHGTAFYDFLALRKRVFVDQLGWDVPHDGRVEMDQYDTPQAHYSVVMRDGHVVGGARAMPTTSTWGPHTYMLRDAFQGKLPHIPPRIMPEDIASPGVWECTRLVIDDSLVTAAHRAECLRLIVDGLVCIARERGATQMICLSSLALMRALRQLGYDVRQMGESYRNAEDGRHYAVLAMPACVAREADAQAEARRAA
ncbi:acyl-homoserine-lactone synthase [Rhodovulum steppense]|uniref:Acyl-homoserine-lactone synthase n=1 Tax=Rhodovulum steppense TaxID=540251 RepID=A0A4V2R353_9RHOB|nr:acyl-homoserine-lactone synthase [Rhodovulum steppense]TCM75073.1 acyl homoserine lactone synthase [Rhodovulum steppense]